MTLAAEVWNLLGQGVADLGAGQTAARWRTLHRWARSGSVSIARLAEAHLDAEAIMIEANRTSDSLRASLYGVWASESRIPSPVLDRRTGSLEGAKHFASGLGVVDRALVTVDAGEKLPWLVEVDVREATTLHLDTSGWSTDALADTRTGTVRFYEHPVLDVVGGSGWYLRRPGFWHGAVGPAACWSGAAAGILDAVDEEPIEDPFRLAARGSMRTEVFVALACLDAAGACADTSCSDPESAEYVAHATRSAIERSCTRLLDSFAEAWGPRPLVADPQISARVADTALYLRQHHGDSDRAVLGSQAPIGGR